MLSLPILEVAISLSFLYCLLSLFATVMQELFASVLRLRGQMLYEGIRHLLDDTHASQWAKEFYKHPLILYMARHTGKKNFSPRPSYLSRASFTTAFRELVREKALASGADSESNAKAIWQYMLSEGAAQLPESTRKVLLAFWREAEGDVVVFEKRVGDWFDETMNRVSGWYKRQAQNWALGIGLTIALLMNVDTLGIAKRLANDTQARQSLTQQAIAFVQDSSAMAPLLAMQPVRDPIPTTSVDADSQGSQWKTWSEHTDSVAQQGRKLGQHIETAQASIGLGWRRDPVCDDAGLIYPICLVMSNLRGEFCLGRPGECNAPSVSAFSFFIFFKFLGYMATACAIALGAPFWFDLLSKLVKLRGSGQKPNSEIR